MNFYWLVLGILAVWRITHLLQAEDGPGHVLVRLRAKLGKGFWAGLLDCFYCLSIWIAVPFSWLIGTSWKERLILWPALSGAAILLERITAKNEPPTSVSNFFVEDEENRDVLWQGTTTNDRDDDEWQQPNPPHRRGY